MIAGLIGIVHEKRSDALLLNVNGVIYNVFTSGRTVTEAADDGSLVTLQTHLVVRDDAMILFGFLTRAELQWFETLINVSGVGPRLACAMLTRFTSDELFAAIQGEAVDLLSTVPGIGKRTASRILLDLRGKLPADLTVSTSGVGLTVRTEASEATEVLQSLGYTLSEARDALARTADVEATTTEERVVAALKVIGG